MKPLPLAIALACAIALLPACGEDNDEPQRSEPFLSSLDQQPDTPEERSIREAQKLFNDTCFARDRALDRAERQELGRPDPDDTPTTAEIQRFVDEVAVPTHQGALEVMRRIEAPPALVSKSDAYLAAYQAAGAELSADLAVIKNPSIQTTVFDEAERLASEAGLTRCAG